MLLLCHWRGISMTLTYSCSIGEVIQRVGVLGSQKLSLTRLDLTCIFSSVTGKEESQA